MSGVPEISTPERLAHLPSPVRANERGPFIPFLPCLEQNSAPRRGPRNRPHHVVSFFPRPGQKSAPRKGLLICPCQRGQVSGGSFVRFVLCFGQKSAPRSGANERGPLVRTDSSDSDGVGPRADGSDTDASGGLFGQLRRQKAVGWRQLASVGLLWGFKLTTFRRPERQKPIGRRRLASVGLLEAAKLRRFSAPSVRKPSVGVSLRWLASSNFGLQQSTL